MNPPAETPKSCEPQLFPHDEPSHAWDLDRLSAAAVAEYQELLADERAVTTRYWRLGRLLCLARKNFQRGQWGPYLQELGLEKTRAFKAMRIYETFATAAETVGLTVAEAYDRRQRRPRKPKADRPAATPEMEANSGRSSVPSWTQFAESITTAVARQLEDAEFWTAAEIATALGEVARAATALRQLEDRLRGRDDSPTDANPSN